MILEEIAQAAKKRVEEQKKRVLAGQIRAAAEQIPSDHSFPFEQMLKRPGLHYICEVKKASPSKGVIAEYFPYVEIAKEYEALGAGAVSCLTEPVYFQGRGAYLQEIVQQVKIPVLRKDFVVDEYMLYEAKVWGASAVLLIAALLDTETLHRYREICDGLGISALIEVHDAREMERALKAGARVIGVNNRNLKDFTVDLDTSRKLRGLAPDGIPFVSESGIQTAEDIRSLRECKVNGVLIGETLMRSADRKKTLELLNGGPLGKEV